MDVVNQNHGNCGKESLSCADLNDLKISNQADIETNNNGGEIILRKSEFENSANGLTSFTSSVLKTHITYNARKTIKFPKEENTMEYLLTDSESDEEKEEEKQEPTGWEKCDREPNWQLEVWLPERRQGPTNKHRIVGMLTTERNFLRILHVRIVGKVSSSNSKQGEQITFCERLQIGNTKERTIFKFRVPNNVELELELEFSCRAIIFPVSFQFALTPIANFPSFPELSWLEEKLRRMPIDDKILIAKHLSAEEKRGWLSLDGSCAMEFDNSIGVAEMQRCSRYKVMAYKLGMIRPFLLLVSMHPRRRIAWANSLGINLVKKHAKDKGKRKTFGDAHWEAYYILTKQRNGFIDRVNHTFREKLNPLARRLDWYQALHRVLCNVMSTRSPGFLKVFETEKMEAEMRNELDQTKACKTETMKASQDPDVVLKVNRDEISGLSPLRLENVFARYFFQSSNVEKVEEIIQTSDSGISNIEAFHDGVVELVRSDSELNEKMECLARHGFTEEKGAAIAVLNSMKKEAMPLCIEVARNEDDDGDDDGRKQPGIRYNKEKWTCDTERFNEEFREKIEQRCKAEKRLLVGQTTIPIAVISLLSALTVSPAVMTILMLTRTGIRAAFPNVPASVAALISGIVMQRLWLAISDIGIEEYYPTKHELKLYQDFQP